MDLLNFQFIDQSVILIFFVKILAFLFLGAFLTSLVAVIIWITSGGSEGRNDLASSMFKSAFSLAFVVMVCYFIVVLYTRFMGISLG